MNVECDQLQLDLWWVSFDGCVCIQFIYMFDVDELQVQWFGDCCFIVFFFDCKLVGGKDDEDSGLQVWMMFVDGGEVCQVMYFFVGVEEFLLLFDGKQLVVIVFDFECLVGMLKLQSLLLIVIDCFQFKDDDFGWFGVCYKYLYVVDIVSGQVIEFIFGKYDEQLLVWLLDSRQIVYVIWCGVDLDCIFNFDIYVIDVCVGVQECWFIMFFGFDFDLYWVLCLAWLLDGKCIVYL